LVLQKVVNSNLKALLHSLQRYFFLTPISILSQGKTISKESLGDKISSILGILFNASFKPAPLESKK